MTPLNADLEAIKRSIPVPWWPRVRYEGGMQGCHIPESISEMVHYAGMVQLLVEQVTSKFPEDPLCHLPCHDLQSSESLHAACRRWLKENS